MSIWLSLTSRRKIPFAAVACVVHLLLGHFGEFKKVNIKNYLRKNLKLKNVIIALTCPTHVHIVLYALFLSEHIDIKKKKL